MAVATHPVEVITLGDTLGGFEETTTAVVAVSEVLGDDYPSLLQSADGTTTLLEQNQTTDHPDTITFSGPAAAAIRMALGIVAEDTTSSYQLPARKILGIPAEPVKRKMPRSKDGVVEEHLKLDTFGRLVAALKSVEEFTQESEEFDEHNEHPVMYRLRDDIDNSPFKSETFYYFGEEAQVIYGSLVKAALRKSTHYDHMAAHILEAVDYGSPALDAAKNASLS